MQIVLVPFEDRMLLHREEDIQVALGAAVGARLTFAGNAQTVAIARCLREWSPSGAC